MGMYLNPGNEGFQSMLRSRYIDKSGLISYINKTLGTPQRLTCVSRPRRFGKSFAAKMLCAYYDKSCNSEEMFAGLKIAEDFSWKKHLNQYNVIYIDFTWFISTSGNIKNVVSYLQKEIIDELRMVYPDSVQNETVSLPGVLAKINLATNQKFLIIIDEWDALFREAKEDIELQKEYILFLRGMFRSSLTDKMIEAAYMTGILPIKKYGTESALSDFYEFTMISAYPLEEYTGFTEQEVRFLCKETGMDFAEICQWYDGYLVGEKMHIYSPKSVLDAIQWKRVGNYWTQTETYESLKSYIEKDIGGLRDAIVSMIAGGRQKISTRTFQNDMVNMKSRDDVMTLLVHLGYLAYDATSQEVYIPNQEIADEFKNAVEGAD